MAKRIEVTAPKTLMMYYGDEFDAEIPLIAVLEQPIISESLKLTEEFIAVLAPPRPGWQLVFYPSYPWVAFDIIPVYLRLAVEGRPPAIGSPTEVSILDSYKRASELARDAYERLKIGDVTTASARIDDIITIKDDIGSTIEMTEPELSWNGTLYLHRMVFRRFSRLCEILERSRERMYRELARPRYFDPTRYERLMNRMRRMYDRRKRRCERLSKASMRRVADIRTRIALAPVWIEVAEFPEIGIYRKLAFTRAFKIHARDVKPNKITWIIGFDWEPPGKEDRDWNEPVLIVENPEPKILHIRFHGWDIKVPTWAELPPAPPGIPPAPPGMPPAPPRMPPAPPRPPAPVPPPVRLPKVRVYYADIMMWDLSIRLPIGEIVEVMLRW